MCTSATAGRQARPAAPLSPRLAKQSSQDTPSKRCWLSSRPTASSSVAGVGGHAGGAEAAERRPRGRPSTAGFHQFGPCLGRGSGGHLCPIGATRRARSGPQITIPSRAEQSRHASARRPLVWAKAPATRVCRRWMLTQAGRPATYADAAKLVDGLTRRRLLHRLAKRSSDRREVRLRSFSSGAAIVGQTRASSRQTGTVRPSRCTAGLPARREPPATSVRGSVVATLAHKRERWRRLRRVLQNRTAA
jgi:hypothetical protein